MPYGDAKAKKIRKIFPIFLAAFKKNVFLQPKTMPNGVIGNTTDSGSVKSRFEPWLGNIFNQVST